MTRIILVRHGQTEWNRVEHYRGRADIPLNDTGLAQADATGRRISLEWESGIAAIYSSPLSRTVQTAEGISKFFDVPVQPFHGLIDLNMGDWQGLTPGQVRERWPAAFAAWYIAPHTVHFPGGETLEHARTRAMSGVHELVERHDGRTIVLVSHTDVNRVILLSVLGLGNDCLWSIRQDNCAINVIEMTDGAATLVSMNDTAHLRSWTGFVGRSESHNE